MQYADFMTPYLLLLGSKSYTEVSLYIAHWILF